MAKNDFTYRADTIDRMLDDAWSMTVPSYIAQRCLFNTRAICYGQVQSMITRTQSTLGTMNMIRHQN